MAAIDVLKEGMGWRIGNGQCAKIWGSKWLPTPTTFSVQSPCSQLAIDDKVAALIDPNQRGWNVPLIQSIFEKEEAETICNIPLSRYDHPDKLVWRATPSGTFTVKSAYYMEQDRQLREKGESSVGKGWESFWKMIWGLKIPNPTKVFLWRACSNLPSTRENLRRRGMDLEVKCVICSQETESIQHVLLECPSAQDVWGVCNRKIQKMVIVGADFREVMEMLATKCSPQEMGLIAVASRSEHMEEEKYSFAWRSFHPSKPPGPRIEGVS